MKLNELFSRMKLSKEKQEKALIGFLLGIFFLLVATPVSSLTGTKKGNDKTADEERMTTNPDISGENNQETNAYISELENKLEKTIKGMEGAGKVDVMITLKNNGEKVLEKNLTYESETETLTEDGRSTEKNVVKNDPETVLVEESGDTSPIVVMQTYPEIEGVVVVCEGGNDTEVALHIKEAVQALFSIDAHKIVVCKSHNQTS